ncbi:MAG: hypothetical protein ACLFQV_12200 [Vulcanimicrobiota bacterium]
MSNIPQGNNPAARNTGIKPGKIKTPSVSQRVQPGEDPGEMVLEYVCSKGDVEYHSINDSFEGVRQHEMHHIEEYHEIANRLGLKVVNPDIKVFSEFMGKINRKVAVGGKATCHFTAAIDGQEVIVPVSKDGFITDHEIARKLELEKKKQSGILSKEEKKKNKKDSQNPVNLFMKGQDYIITH